MQATQGYHPSPILCDNRRHDHHNDHESQRDLTPPTASPQPNPIRLIRLFFSHLKRHHRDSAKSTSITSVDPNAAAGFICRIDP
jgi:hypothetical protein